MYLAECDSQLYNRLAQNEKYKEYNQYTPN